MGLTHLVRKKMPKRRRSSFRRSAKKPRTGGARFTKFTRTRQRRRSRKSRSTHGGSRTSAITNPPRFYNLAPRVRTTHINRVSTTITHQANAVINAVPIILFPNRLRDPYASTSDQCFPENFTTMSRLYSDYRVSGVSVFLDLHGLGLNENQKFYAIAYYLGSGDPDPYTPATVPNPTTRNAMLQQPEIRKKMITSAGTYGDRRNSVWKVGYYSIAAMQEMDPKNMDDLNFAGRVTESGGLVKDPTISPTVYIRLVDPTNDGFEAAKTFTVNIFLKFHVQWFNRRETIEPNVVVPA